MSDRTTESAETLAEALMSALLDRAPSGALWIHTEDLHPLREHLAAALLASDWMKRHDAEVRAERNEGLADYLAQMDRAGGGIYTSDFREGFRHALAMLAAYESDEEPSPDRVRPEVREAARLALSRRAALAEEGDHQCDTGHFDRTVCPEPCGMMHSYCATCGDRQDRCAHEPDQ